MYTNIIKGRNFNFFFFSVTAGDVDAPRPLQLLEALAFFSLLRVCSGLFRARGNADTGLQAALSLSEARLRAYPQRVDSALASHA